MKQNLVKILIAIVAIVTIWGGHTYAMTPPTLECQPTVGTRYIASACATPVSTGATPTSIASTPPEQFKIPNSPFQITHRGGSPSHV